MKTNVKNAIYKAKLVYIINRADRLWHTAHAADNQALKLQCIRVKIDAGAALSAAFTK